MELAGTSLVDRMPSRERRIESAERVTQVHTKNTDTSMARTHSPSLTANESADEPRTTEDILYRIARGDSDAVSDCLDRYGNFLWSLAKRYCGEAEAEDAVQEIFVELWRSAERFDRSKASEMTFVALVARRRLIDRRRRGGSAPDLVSIEDSGCDVAQSTGSDVVELSDEAAKAGECLKKLSEKQQTVLQMSIDQAQPHTAIAERLKMPLGTVKSYARRGLLQLRECMQRPLTAEAL
ncbi:MAG: sigma-70 family RNA polymerase sigma factor [Planctomycetota bacterium]